MKIDIHVHSMFSYDCDLDPRHLVRRGKEIGLDALCITDHNTVEKSAPVLEAAQEIDFLVLRGVELSTTVGHILLFGVTSDCWKTPYSRSKLPPEAVLDLVDAVSGAAVIAHPFKPGYQFHTPEILEHPRVCALETCNGQCLDGQNLQAHRMAQQYCMAETGGSDAHLLHEIGACYTLFDRAIASERDLIEALLTGNVLGKSMKKTYL